MTLPARRGDFDLFFGDFFIVFISDIIGVRVNIFIGVKLFGFAVFLNVFILFSISCFLLSLFSF